MNGKYECNKMANTNLTMGCRSSHMVVGMVLHYKKVTKKLEEIFQLCIQCYEVQNLPKTYIFWRVWDQNQP